MRVEGIAEEALALIICVPLKRIDGQRSSERQAGLELRFVDAIHVAIRSACEAPQRWRTFDGEIIRNQLQNAHGQKRCYLIAQSLKRFDLARYLLLFGVGVAPPSKQVEP